MLERMRRAAVKVLGASAKVSYANALTQSSRNLTIQFLSQQPSTCLGSIEGWTFKRSLTNRRGRPVEIRSFVTANVIVRAVNREYLEAFQSPATFANREILRSSRSYFLLSKVVLAQKKNKSAQNTKDL